MRHLKLLAVAGLALFQFSACVKDKKIEPIVLPSTENFPLATVAFDFAATVNNKPLVPNSTWYTNAYGDSFTVSKFNYYISNIKFKRADGFVFAEPESYRINKHADGPVSFVIKDLPDGTYNSVEFLIGVDSVRNSSGAQTGALDVAQNMFWDWNTGYVFFKLEGNYKTELSPVESGYSIHVGEKKNLQKCILNFGATPVTARKNKQSHVHYEVNIDEIFTAPSDLDFDTYHGVSGGRPASVVAENYKDMFSVKQVEN